MFLFENCVVENLIEIRNYYLFIPRKNPVIHSNHIKVFVCYSNLYYGKSAKFIGKLKRYIKFSY